MLTAAHVVLLGEDADAQACVAAALPPMALGRLRRTCRGASGAAPVGVDWAWLRHPSEFAKGARRDLLDRNFHDKEDPDAWDTLYMAAHQGRAAVLPGFSCTSTRRPAPSSTLPHWLPTPK